MSYDAEELQPGEANQAEHLRANYPAGFEEKGKPLPNRRERRAWAREQARALNRTRHRTVVAYQKED